MPLIYFIPFGNALLPQPVPIISGEAHAQHPAERPKKNQRGL
jgi:hypothetical protein